MTPVHLLRPPRRRPLPPPRRPDHPSALPHPRRQRLHPVDHRLPPRRHQRAAGRRPHRQRRGRRPPQPRPLRSDQPLRNAQLRRRPCPQPHPQTPTAPLTAVSRSIARRFGAANQGTPLPRTAATHWGGSGVPPQTSFETDALNMAGGAAPTVSCSLPGYSAGISLASRCARRASTMTWDFERPVAFLARSSASTNSMGQ